MAGDLIKINKKIERMKTPEEWIIQQYGREWLNHHWSAGDVEEALRDYATSVVEEKEAERCEWNKSALTNNVFCECNDYAPGILFIFQAHFTYCPFCGKKIERVN